MDNQLDIIEWFKRMGYEDPIPESLVNICNKSTFYIWNELIQNTKPKQDVENLRNNIIINRLKNKPLTKQDDFSHPIKNIMLYLKRESLEKKVDSLRNSIEEKKCMVNNQSKNNEMKYLATEIIKSKIKENKEREFLLSKKCQLLERNIQDAEEALAFTKTLTPVELEENPNVAEITETLQKCAEKLEKLLKKIHKDEQKSFRFYSAQKQPKTETVSRKYLIMSERKLSERTTIVNYGGSGMRRDKGNKENLGGNRKVNKNLFADTNERNRNRGNKRESLGILSDSYLNDNELNISTESDSFKEFASICSDTKTDLYVASPKRHSDLDYTLQLNKRQQIPKSLAINEIYKDEFVTNKLSNLLYNHNRQIIWKTFQTLNDNLQLAVTKNIILESDNNEKCKNVNREDIAKLYFLHIQTELQTLKLKAILNDILNKVTEKKKSIYVAINSRGLPSETIEQVAKLFELQLDDLSLDVSLAEMKKEINAIKSVEDHNDLHITLEKITQTKENIIYKIDSIKQYIGNVYDAVQSIVRTNEMTTACVRKLGPFVEDLTWSSPLTQGLHSNEIRTFGKFPLEYNRRCVYTDPGKYYRDITYDIPAGVDLDTDTLYMLTELLENPFSPPELIVLQILKSKIKLNALRCLPNHTLKDTYKKYSLTELQAQESYIQYALDRLSSILFSTSADKTLSTVEYVKSIMEIWLEMPLKDFISPLRNVEGHDYKYYEKHYDSFYNC